jgi:TRAP-type mannitol/chloroaromatic compound transport system substrate-binding protein
LAKVPGKVSKYVSTMTNGRFVIEVDYRGLPTEKILADVQANKIQSGFSGIYYAPKGLKALYFGCAIPFGLSPQEQTAWLRYKKNPDDGFTYIQSLYAKLDLGNVIPFPAAATGGQMGGWFKKELSSVDSLKGLKMRIPGLGAEVMAELGVITEKVFKDEKEPRIPIHQIATTLENEDINAAEWTGPYDDTKLGLHKAGADFYYFPGWWEPSTTLDIQVSKKAWDGLDEDFKSIFQAACDATYQEILSEYDIKNATFLQKLIDKKVTIRRFPGDILKEAQDQTDKLLRDYDLNKTFNEVHEEWQKFRKSLRKWNRLTNLDASSFDALRDPRE